MSDVYSKRFASLTSSQSSVTVAVPAGKVWIVTNVDLTVGAGSAGFAAYANAPGIAVFAGWNVPANAGWVSYHFAGRMVLAAGETLQLLQSPATGWMVANGYELAAAP